jgi:hypothetical protein
LRGREAYFKKLEASKNFEIQFNQTVEIFFLVFHCYSYHTKCDFLSIYYIYSDIYMALGVGWDFIFVTGQGSVTHLSGSAGSG